MLFDNPTKRSPDLTGQRFHSLLVLCYVGISKNSCHVWLCRCDCGKEIEIPGIYLRRKRPTQSCGCLRLKRVRAALTKHNLCGTRIYMIHSLMMARCYCGTRKEYVNYGERGIRVCERWHDVSLFALDMGEPPSPLHSIERENNDGNYEPENCYWATKKEQQNNTRQNHHVTAFGKTQNVSQWAEETGIPRTRIYHRLKVGWSPERALTTPPMAMGRRCSRVT